MDQIINEGGIYNINTNLKREKENSAPLIETVVGCGGQSIVVDGQPRQHFKKSHTCGSLYVNCGSSPPEVTSYSIQEQKRKPFFQSYSHPDTAFVFTEANKNAGEFSVRSQSIKTKSGRVEIKTPQRRSNPNIGSYSVLDVAVHPEIVVKVTNKSKPRPILKKSATTHCESTTSVDLSESYHSSTRTVSTSKSECESQDECLNWSPDAITATIKDSPITNYVDSSDISKRLSAVSSELDSYDDNWEYHKYNALAYKHQPKQSQQSYSCSPAQQFLKESGILGPMGNGSSCIPTAKRTSKVAPTYGGNGTSSIIDHIRRNSQILSRQESKTPDSDEVEYVRSIFPNLKLNEGTINNRNPQLLVEDEVKRLKGVIKDRDTEIHKLKREIHKLKSVLQQTTQSTMVADGDLLSSIQANHHMAGQEIQYPSPQSNNSIKINPFTQATLVKQYSQKVNSIGHAPSIAAVKKQGVSGESSDAASYLLNDIEIPKYEKDFRSKQLIKDAIMDNDFLKNIDSSQVRELVESMYLLEVGMGEYVVHEGEAGAHLYVAADGEFEVIKEGKVLGVMGAGKAFGELAILYNCTRTASIRVLSDSSVWVLDRRVFQKIMMRTGLQRIEENVNFLRSVPLLHNLSTDLLTKIADVLEVEFYPASTYIIRQGASGDTFFLISQGNVQVTQRAPNSMIEESIRTLGRGDYFGEQALIKEDKRTANIVALSPGVECLTLDRDSFSHLIGNLCELHEKDYGDEFRVLAMKDSERKQSAFGAHSAQEFLDVELSDLEHVSTLGVGGFGRVELVRLVRGNEVQTFALKCLKKRHIVDTHQEDHVFSERTIMLACKSPFICRMFRTYRNDKYVYMLMEACMGGEVWTILRNRGYFDEHTTQFIIGCVLQAFEYLHTRGVIYRDLKPENLMLDASGYVKLVDFGFAKYTGYSCKTWTFCGTPEYVAPEIILNRGHDRAVDYWALGILIHELLTGTPPFTATDPMKTYNIILKGIDMVDFPKHMSRASITLIKKLCRDVPAERLGYQKGDIQDIKKSKWFQGFDWDGLANRTLLPLIVQPVDGPMDTSNFDDFPMDTNEPPNETSGWDADF